MRYLFEEANPKNANAKSCHIKN